VTVHMIPKMRQLEKTVSLFIEFFNLAGSHKCFALVNAVSVSFNKGCFRWHKQYQVFCLGIHLTQSL